MKLNYQGKVLDVILSKYTANDRLAVRLQNQDGSCYAVLSINVVDADIGPDEFVAKVYSENESLRNVCQPLFVDTGRTIKVGYYLCPIWRLKQDKIVVIKITQTAGYLGERVMAIFDDVDSADAWCRKQPEQKHVRYITMEVPYKP